MNICEESDLEMATAHNIAQTDLEMLSIHQIGVNPQKSTLQAIEGALKEILFPDDPFRKFKNQPAKRKCLL